MVDNDWFDDEGNPILWGSAHSGSANGQHGAGGTHGNGHKDGHHGHGHHGHGEKVSNSGKETTTNHSETAGSLIINPTVKAIDGVVTFFRGYLIPKVSCSSAFFSVPLFFLEKLWFEKQRYVETK